MREIGIFMSMGADDANIRRIFMLESLILGGIGGFLGVGLGLILSLFINPIIMNISITVEDVLYNAEWLSVIPLSIAISLLVCFIASLYPAWKASTVDPVEALRGGM
jgi:lipoprotein-releasing system permease protein